MKTSRAHRPFALARLKEYFGLRSTAWLEEYDPAFLSEWALATLRSGYKLTLQQHESLIGADYIPRRGTGIVSVAFVRRTQRAEARIEKQLRHTQRRDARLRKAHLWGAHLAERVGNCPKCAAALQAE